MSEPTPLLGPIKPKQVEARLWRNNTFVANGWRAIADDEALPASGRFIVSLARWRSDANLRTSAGKDIGISVDVGAALDVAADAVGRLALVALPFPKFSDGRSYSTARRLREAGFKGEIRATGDVLLDQLPLMLRAGFDAFEITNAATIAALEKGHVPAVPQVYQSGAEQGAPANLFSRRVARKPTGARA